MRNVKNVLDNVAKLCRYEGKASSDVAQASNDVEQVTNLQLKDWNIHPKTTQMWLLNVRAIDKLPHIHLMYISELLWYLGSLTNRGRDQVHFPLSAHKLFTGCSQERCGCRGISYEGGEGRGKAVETSKHTERRRRLERRGWRRR